MWPLSGVALQHLCRLVAGEVQQSLNSTARTLTDILIDKNFISACFKHMRQLTQTVHCHPRAVCTADTGCAAASSRGLDNFLTRRGLLHLVKDAPVGSHNKHFCIHAFDGIDQAGGRADIVGLFDDGGG